MKLKSLFSTQELRRQLAIAGRRLPFSIAFLCVATVLFIFNILDDQAIIKQPEAIIWGGVLGVLSTLAVYLWCELLGSRRLLKPLLIFASAITVADVCHILYLGNFGSNAEALARGALFVALTVAVLFPPFSRGGNRRIMFRFTVEQLRAILMIVALGLVLSIASVIILGTISVLFDTLSEKFCICWFTIASFFIPGLFYMTRVPRIAHLRRAPDADPMGVGNATVYVLLPLVAIYMGILYVYGLLIVARWELPLDSLSLMVSGLLCASMVALYGMQAFNLYDRVDRRSEIAAFSARWLPVLLFPLLILMTVGLCYRFNQYGITISRLYVATFALWAYVVVIYLSVKARGANLNSVAASFAAVFALVTIFPYANYSTLTLNYMERSVKKSLGDMDFPASMSDIKNRLNELPEEKANLTSSRILYLFEYARQEQYAKITNYDKYLFIDELTPEIKKDEDKVFSLDARTPAPVPEGYSHVEYLSFYRNSISVNGNIAKISKEDKEILLNIDSLVSRVNDSVPVTMYAKAITPADSTAIFVMTESAGTINNKVITLNRVAGYLFEK